MSESWICRNLECLLTKWFSSTLSYCSCSHEYTQNRTLLRPWSTFHGLIGLSDDWFSDWSIGQKIKWIPSNKAILPKWWGLIYFRHLCIVTWIVQLWIPQPINLTTDSLKYQIYRNVLWHSLSMVILNKTRICEQKFRLLLTMIGLRIVWYKTWLLLAPPYGYHKWNQESFSFLKFLGQSEIP